MRRYFIMLMLIFFSIQATTANNPIREGGMISGHVVEMSTEVNIPYATIRIKETGKGVVTNEYGEFELRGLDAGTYHLTASFTGYKSETKEVKVSDDYTAVLHFQLEREDLMIDEVVVSANRSETKRRDAPVVVNVMGKRLFDIVNAVDLAKTLNYQSGLRVENNCQNCGFSQVRINGLEGPYSQILINSRPVVSALSGVYGLEQIPTNMIERVEVVRGGGSALFGANAVGGTINIITKDPVNDSFEVSSTMSNIGSQVWEQNVGANVSMVSKNNTHGIALYGNYHNQNPYDRDGDGFSEMVHKRMSTFGFRSYYRPTFNSRIGLEYHNTNEFRRGGNRFDFQPHEADIAEQLRHNINSGGITYDLFWKDYKHKLSLFASAQHIDRDSYYGAQRDPNAYGKTDDLTWIGGATLVTQIDKFIFAPSSFTAGLEYQENTLHDIMTGYKRDMRQKVKIGSAFVQNEWKMSKFTLLAGARLDKHNLIDKLIFSPRVNLLYKPTDNLQARLTYSPGFRAPQAYDEDLHINVVGGQGVQIKLAEGLKEERSNSFSGSTDYYLYLGHWQANVLLEGFYTRLDNVFVLEELGKNADGLVIKERRNGAGAKVYGANIDAKIAHGTDVSFQMGFTMQRSRYTQDEVWTEVDGKPLTTRRMTRTPDYYGYFTFTYAPLKHFDFALTGTYTGEMIVPHFAGYIKKDRMEHSPAFLDLNLKLKYTFVLNDHVKMQVNTGIQNIFNSFQKDLDKGEFRDAGYFYGPTRPRTFFVGLKFTT